MPAFPKPKFAYSYQVASQVKALRHWRDHQPGRAIPPKGAGTLLLATWNIANLGLQDRRPSDLRLMAEIVSWFDLVTIQEVNENCEDLVAIRKFLPGSWRLLFSDAAGKAQERIAFLYDSAKVELLELIGQVNVPPRDLAKIRIAGIAQAFTGFDRDPYLASFKAGSLRFTLVSVHLYFGSESTVHVERRSLETLAVARWADLERRSEWCYCDDIIVLGDFNLPKPSDNPVFKALVSMGLKLPNHTSEIGSSIASDNHYDQIAFFPGNTWDDFTGKMSVFDFDGCLFRTLWESRPRKDFMAYMRYYISDHRPLWAEFRI